VLGRRDAIAGIIGLTAGFAVAVLDSRPGFDDTGITVLSLILAAAVVAFISGRRPWIWALTVGAWLPILEVRDLANAEPILALAFFGTGAAIGRSLARSRRA
jgi:hypothetical protein